jgi:hypothetical protein
METPHRCYFCYKSLTSSSIECDECGGLALPTQDGDHEKIIWATDTFGTRLSGPSLPSRVLSSSWETFHQQELSRFAIRIGDGFRAVLFVKDSRPQRMVSFWQSGEVKTLKLKDVSENQKMLLNEIVHAVLPLTGRYPVSKIYSKIPDRHTDYC